MTEDCTLDVKYIYTVTNVGLTTENINSLSIKLNGNVKDWIYALDTTELVPGDDVVTTEITSFDIWQQETTVSVSAELYKTLPNDTPFEDTAVYEIDVENICDVEVEAECVFEDDSNTDCHLNPELNSQKTVRLWQNISTF